MVRKNGGMLKRGSSRKPKNYDLCHKCGRAGHFIKDCPLLKQEFPKYNPEKATKRNPALAAWGDSSSESEDEIDAGDSSMMAVESEEDEYDSTFTLMDQLDDDGDDDNNEVNFRDVQRNLKSYSPKKLMSLVIVLIDAYHSLVDDKDALTLELGEVEQIRDDLVVCVVDLKETICELEKEKCVLTEKIANIEHERDDLVVVVVDHKETIENFIKENEALVKRVNEIEEERDDLLVVVAYLMETIEKLGTESKPENTGKGKEVAIEEHIRLENELKAVRTRLCVETEKNKHLQTEPERVKNDLEKSLKWTWSSKVITTMYVNNGENRHGIGFQGRKPLTTPIATLQGGSVSFGNGKKGYILGVGKVGKSLTHYIENVYYVNGLKYNLLSVSQKIGARKLLSSEQTNSEGPGPWSAHVQGTESL
ncbi:uncharacterized protein [Nicotiana sylvestris]|uniref:uncharacterized protein n=1 Tax=Nicotiana sylvestris TaxID=4096 RepID=UPI00388C380B